VVTGEDQGHGRRDRKHDGQILLSLVQVSSSVVVMRGDAPLGSCQMAVALHNTSNLPFLNAPERVGGVVAR